MHNTELFTVNQLRVKRYLNRGELGRAAASELIQKVDELLREQEQVNMIFAAAPSQKEFLQALSEAKTLEWNRVNAFHMDEYVGLPPEATQRFGNFLNEHIFSKLPFRAVHYLNGNHPDLQIECLRYAELLLQHPTDVLCLGIGENGHIAFNDPHVADFNDPELVKVVDLDDACRQQQVNDKCFNTKNEVPTYAITLTVPALMSARFAFCMVPGAAKAKAVSAMLLKPVSPQCPASALKNHPNATLYADRDSFGGHLVLRLQAVDLE